MNYICDYTGLENLHGGGILMEQLLERGVVSDREAL